jgi:hypothetical protein
LTCTCTPRFFGVSGTPTRARPPRSSGEASELILYSIIKYTCNKKCKKRLESPEVTPGAAVRPRGRKHLVLCSCSRVARPCVGRYVSVCGGAVGWVCWGCEVCLHLASTCILHTSRMKSSSPDKLKFAPLLPSPGTWASGPRTEKQLPKMGPPQRCCSRRQARLLELASCPSKERPRIWFYQSPDTVIERLRLTSD